MYRDFSFSLPLFSDFSDDNDYSIIDTFIVYIHTVHIYHSPITEGKD